jgi:hypothetical protein
MAEDSLSLPETKSVRSASLLAPPVKLDNAFDDPDGVIALIKKGAPYKTEEAVHKHPGVTHTGGWFRNFWALGGKVVFDGAEPFFHNANFIEAARKSFQAEVIRPVAMMTNLNLPMAGLPPHLDLPFFRGTMNREVPAWMLAPMGYAGLFHNWAVPVASAISWFYDGAGGEFEYWPKGFDKASKLMRPPFFNTAVLADNEYMHHRVGSIGRPEDFVAEDAIPYHAKLALVGDDQWQVQEEGSTLASYDYAAVRLSVLWKAYCFKTEAEAVDYDDKRHDLTPELVTELFCADLTARDIKFVKPGDIFTDVAWKQTLEAAYPAPDVTA